MNSQRKNLEAESFWDARAILRERVRRYYGLSSGPLRSVHEVEPLLAPLNERLLHLIWSKQHFDATRLKLVGGGAVHLDDPGRLNGSSGPDFENASLVMNGESRRGDVELHLYASDWRRHNHERDLDYNGVILHVVLFNDDGREADVLHNGSTVPRLELEPYLTSDLVTLRRILGPEDFAHPRPSTVGRCYEVMTSARPDELCTFLDLAGDERFEAKIRRVQDQGERADPGQVLYQALMSGLGAGAGKPLYYLLARRVPLADLKAEAGRKSPGADENCLLMESVLLHVANLMPGPDVEMCAEAQAHASRLEEIWAPLRSFWEDRSIPASRAWYRDIRPVNFPPRRLVAVARMYSHSWSGGGDLLEDLLDRVRSAGRALEHASGPRAKSRICKELAMFFEVPLNGGFWESHYSFSAKPMRRPAKLIGDASARSLAFNTGLPIAAMTARRRNDGELDAAVLRLYRAYPRLPANHVVDFTRDRLFGEQGAPGGLFRTERRQQGLFQIFNSCCGSESNHCNCCHYLEGAEESWPGEERSLNRGSKVGQARNR